MAEFTITQAFEGYDELYSIVEEQDITEAGVYKKDHTPDEYKGSGILTVRVVHAVFLVDDGGNLKRLSFDIAEAKDEEDLLGGPVNLDGKEIQSQTGASEVATELKREFSTKLLATSPERFQKGIEMAKSAEYLPLNYPVGA